MGLSDDEFAYLKENLLRTHIQHEYFQRKYLCETGRRWVQELYLTDVGNMATLQINNRNQKLPE